MADNTGQAACTQAYQAAIAQCNSVLISNLGTAANDEDRQVAIDEFKKGIDLCKEALKVCQETLS